MLTYFGVYIWGYLGQLFGGYSGGILGYFWGVFWGYFGGQKDKKGGFVGFFNINVLTALSLVSCGFSLTKDH